MINKGTLNSQDKLANLGKSGNPLNRDIQDNLHVTFKDSMSK